MPKINGIEVNNAQFEAIIHGEGPMLVIAGPGSGKTTVITQRVKYLLEHHHVRPEEILVITFTKAAASEMHERFLRMMNTPSCLVTFGTFHAIYFHILKQAYHYQRNNILTESEKYKFLKEAMQMIPYESDTAREDAILQNDSMQLLLNEIAKIKNDGIAVEEYESGIVDTLLFQKIFRKYHQILAENRKLDFDDMVLQCYQLFTQRKDILQGWRQRFRYILIDEFQDICPMQFKVIRQLAYPRNNLFIVGDDDQAIYHFRGSNPKIMLDFPILYPNTRKILLNINYRSQEDILKASLSLISHNENRYSKEIIPYYKSHQKNHHVTYHAYRKEEEQIAGMMGYIKEHIRKGGKYADIAILYRTNIGASGMAEKCAAFKIPFEMKEKIQNIYDKFYAQDIIAYLRFSCEEKKRSYFYQIMNKPVRYIQRASVKTEIVQKEELLSFYHDKEYVRNAIETLWMQMILLKEMSPFAAINFIRKGMGYDDYLLQLAKDKKLEGREWMDALDEIQSTARNFSTIKEWLNHIEQYSENLKKADRKKEDAVEIMTMHAAKGLEWDNVWIPDLNEGIMPHKKAELTEELEEERRMLYVAMTRARKELILSYVTSPSAVSGQEKLPSRFMKEIFPDFENNNVLKAN